VKEMEDAYWEHILQQSKKPAGEKTPVIYGSHVATSMMGSCDEFPGLNLNNCWSMLTEVVHLYYKPMQGLTSPMLYIGTEFSTFPPHLEDNDLWSTSYMHVGDWKIWLMFIP